MAAAVDHPLSNFLMSRVYDDGVKHKQATPRIVRCAPAGQQHKSALARSQYPQQIKASTPSWNFSMADSSDDEPSVKPIKFSAEVKSLLGDEFSVASSPANGSQRPSKEREQMSTFGSSESQRGQHPEIAFRKPPSPTMRNGTPRIVRLSPMERMGSATLQKSQWPNAASIPKEDSASPLLRSDKAERYQPKESALPNHDSNHDSLTGSENNKYSQRQLGSPETGEEQGGDIARMGESSMHEAEAQLGTMSITRSRGDESGMHTGRRQMRPQVTGRFLKGPARRGGLRRRQSEEDASPKVEKPAETIENGPVSSELNTSAHPTSLVEQNIQNKTPKIYEDENYRIRHTQIPARHDIGDGQRTTDPAGEDHNKEALSVGARDRGLSSSQAVNSNLDQMFKPPPILPLSSRHDQENEPPPTFRRTKRGNPNEINKLGQIMLAETPIGASPSRAPLAVRSSNTPLRPPPPPPKMSILQSSAVAATAVAPSSVAHKKKRNLMSVNRAIYTRMDCIGRGGSSKVYRVMAEDYTILALKRVTLEDQDELAIRGYKGEIDLLRQLQGVDRVIGLRDYEINEEKKILSVLMEAGEADLANMFKERLNCEGAVLDLTWTRYFWKEMVECVSAVHAVNIVHSDLKPANFVLLKGKLKLIDFGISNAIADDTVNVHREHHIGTPNYMSPEALIDSNVAAGVSGIDGKLMKIGKPSDVWSLGCILYQMVYGKPPFAHIASQVQRIMAIPNPRHPISFPDRGLGDVPVPENLMQTLKSCLDRDLTRRPTTQDLLSASDRFLHPDPIDSIHDHDLSKSRYTDPADRVSIDRNLLERLQHNILNHVTQHGVPSSEELKVWPDKFFRSIKAAVEQGRA